MSRAARTGTGTRGSDCDGTVPVIRYPVDFDEFDASVHTDSRPLGADTDHFLRELGYDDAELAALREVGDHLLTGRGRIAAHIFIGIAPTHAMDGKQYEEFNVGDAYTSPWRYISESDLRQFLALTGIQEPLFESHQFLESETDHETWIVPGYLTLSYSLGLFSRSGWITRTGLAMLGAEELEFTNPVLVGDEIRTRVEVADTSLTSSDRGGVVVLDWVVQTQDDLVLEMTSSHFIKKGE